MHIQRHKQTLFIGVLVALVATTMAPTIATATTPAPNSAVIQTRIFNDCPTSILTETNSYPSLISILDERLDCGGFANLHNWRFSEDGVTPVDFDNDSNFTFGASLTISGTADGEAGLQVSPWFSQDVDGRFNIRTTDGEIACFGGRLPFYSFTGDHGLVYVKGTTIELSITYLANDLTAMDPATIEYRVEYGGSSYTSGQLAFDEGNPAEDRPYGLWGILQEARVGGHVQPFLQAGNPDAALQAEWGDIFFESNDPVPVEQTTWGKIKAGFNE